MFLWPPADVSFVNNVIFRWSPVVVHSVMIFCARTAEVDWKIPEIDLSGTFDEEVARMMFLTYRGTLPLFTIWLSFEDIKYIAMQAQITDWTWKRTEGPSICIYPWPWERLSSKPGAASEKGQFLKYNPKTKKLYGTEDYVEISFRQLLEKYKDPYKDIALYAAIFESAHVPVNTENGKMTVRTRDFINNFSSRISEMPPKFTDELLKCVRANAGPTIPLAFAGNMLFYVTIEAETKQDFTFYQGLTSSRSFALRDVANLLNCSLAKVKALAEDFPPCYHHEYVFPFSAMDTLIGIVDDPSIKNDAKKYQELIRSVGYIYTPSDIS
ncbi:unnamed protein product [Caenorhabditis auriculariae]|uniref:Uncharacterized protein n=1 Tax=Caenorhabditis auriculariae TaxID=2777116 RepID=A0A8S1H3B8_9PELO|nr:unnamed protein product [Caenorhabditis auriculariae]